MPKHIAFFAVPAHGHVNPSLSLVAELARRGHRVTFATTDTFADAVAAAGAEVIRHETTFPGPGETWPEDDVSAVRLFHDEVVAVLPQVEAAYRGQEPDVIVHDIGAYHAPLLASRWKVPAIQLSPTFVAFEGMAERFGIDLHAEPAPEVAAMNAEFEELAAGYGRHESAATIRHEPGRIIATIPRSWQFNGDEVGPHVTFVGPAVDARTDEWTRPDDRPVLLVSLGSAYNDRPDFYRTCVEAFADLDWTVVLNVGRSVDPAVLGEVPDNIRVHQWVPQIAVLAQASAFVTHAGMGSLTEALYFGVPMVAVPQGVDQHLNGARLTELAMGEHLPADEVTADRLRAAVLHVSSDPVIAANLATMRAEIRAAGGSPAAADVVEAAL